MKSAIIVAVTAMLAASLAPAIAQDNYAAGIPRETYGPKWKWIDANPAVDETATGAIASNGQMSREKSVRRGSARLFRAMER